MGLLKRRKNRLTPPTFPNQYSSQYKATDPASRNGWRDRSWSSSPPTSRRSQVMVSLAIHCSPDCRSATSEVCRKFSVSPSLTSQSTSISQCFGSETVCFMLAAVMSLAVIAWMRHQTTGYDSLVIPRVMGKRREVRRLLARRSHDLLTRYRRGNTDEGECPLREAFTLQNTAPYSSTKPVAACEEKAADGGTCS